MAEGNSIYKTIDQIKTECEQIKNETTAKHNTATRVGGAMLDIINHVENTIDNKVDAKLDDIEEEFEANEAARDALVEEKVGEITELQNGYDDLKSTVNGNTIIGKYINNLGEVKDDELAFCTDFIPAKRWVKLTFKPSTSYKYCIAVYDSEKNFLQYTNGNSSQEKIYTPNAEGTSFIRASFMIDDIDSSEIRETESGDVIYTSKKGIEKEIEEIKSFDSNQSSINNNLEQGIKNNKDYVDNKLEEIIVYSPNLFDKESDNLKNGYLTPTQFVENTGYRVTHPIKVLNNTSYSFNRTTTYIGSNNATVRPCDYEGNILSGSITATLEGDVYTFTNSSFDYVCVNAGTTSKIGEFMFCMTELYPSSYKPYGLKKLSPDVEVETDAKSPLEGKSISFEGDSICYGDAYLGGYGKIIAEKYNMEYENKAIGGGTVAETYTSQGAKRHCICEGVETLNADADYAIFEGGVNDSSSSSSPIGETGGITPLGAITEGYTSELDKTTFYGALEYLCKSAVLHFNKAKLGYIIVQKTSPGFRAPNGLYYKAIKEVCAKWGIPVLDLNISIPPIGQVEELYHYTKQTSSSPAQYDRVHPTEECYRKFFVPKIISWLESL